MVGDPSPQQPVSKEREPTSVQGCGSHVQWLDALQRALGGEIANNPCPCCGECRLQLRIVAASADAARGTIYFWCDRCLWGLIPNAGPVSHAGGTVVDETFEPPDYRIVQP